MESNTNDVTMGVEEQVAALAQEQESEEIALQSEEEVEEQEPVEEEAEEIEEEEAPQEKPPSRRESLRIQALVQKLKEKESSTPSRSSVTPGLDYGTALDADPETVSALDEDRRVYGDNRYNEGIAVARSIQFHTRLEIDAPRVEAKYPILDKSSETFNPQVADALNTMFLSSVGYDPESDTVRNADIRYSDYIDSMMELVEATAGEKIAKSTKNIAKQAAVTGLRPDGSSPKRLNLNKAPSEMDDAELDAVIAQAIPQKAKRR